VAFLPGYVATFSFGGTDISQYLDDVKFSPVRKETDLEVLGGGAVSVIVGPVKTEIDLTGFIDPAVTALFTAHMAEATPTNAAMVFHPQGTGPSRTCVGFLAMYDEDAPSSGPGKWSAKIHVNGAVTYG
jgi:hypothetical protein